MAPTQRDNKKHEDMVRCLIETYTDLCSYQGSLLLLSLCCLLDHSRSQSQRVGAVSSSAAAMGSKKWAVPVQNTVMLRAREYYHEEHNGAGTEDHRIAWSSTTETDCEPQ